jgi:hypothetical protein
MKSTFAPIRWILIAAVALAGVLASAGPASAQMTVDLSILGAEEAPEGEDGEAAKKDPKEPPTFRAVVDGVRPGLLEKDFLLKQVDVDPARVQKPAKVTGYPDSDEPLSLVVVVQGDENWIGNEMYNQENPLLGAFRGVGPALDALATMGPPGSKAMVLTYSSDPGVRPALSMGSIKELGAGALGSQEAFKDAIGSPLETSLKEAYNILAKEGARRKVLVVIGDGHGQSEQTSAKDIKDEAKRLQALGVDMYSIYHQVDQSLDANTGLRNMKEIGEAGAMNAVSSSDFEANAKSIVEDVNARYYVDFVGAYSPKEGEGFTWDNAPHDFVVSVEGNDSEAKSLLLSWTPPPVDEGGSLWWLWLLIILLVVIIIIVIIVKKRSGDQPVEQPMPEMPMEAPPPMAAAPAKTIMLGLGGSDEGMPIVGWIVPLTGPHQYQTFKLLQGATKVGTGGEAHIHIDDQFMSTAHAEIMCSPVGFMLKDAGSTNGTFVNQKRIDSHELVDNDVFTLGRTDFKFKSIN